MAILDSDILIGLLRNDAGAKAKINAIIERHEALSTTAISSFELFKGAFLSRKKEENIREVYSLFQSMRLIPFDFKASFVCGQKYMELSGKKPEIPLADVMIASIAISSGETLITRNDKDFRLIHGLKIESW